ncbi:MAG: metalloregulator ArsR/SmtB family transcription factor [Proteobacteria bacterium]|nr:metalloregulator ArsR/SmtB family transcription factor [Pseudomonadota bacterium]
MSSKNPKSALAACFAGIAKALGHPQRLDILEHLAQGERSVDVLAACLHLPIANVSQHLRVMRQAGLLASRRDGKRVFYSVADSSVVDLLTALRRVGERNLAQVREVLSGYYRERDAFEPVSRKDLAQRLKRGEVVVLDVRPEDEFAAGHVPDAINIPLKDLPKRLRQIPKDTDVIAYCRGPYCVFAFEAVALLRQRGFAARRLEDGFPEWQAHGLPVQRSP